MSDAAAMVTTNGPGLAKAEVSAPAALANMPAWAPRTMRQIWWMAGVVLDSGLVPGAVTRAADPKAAAMVIITTGLELGLGVMQSLRHISVIDGKPCLSAALIVARVKRSPVCKYFQITTMNAKECVCVTHREGDPEPTRLTWTLEEAKNASLLGKDNWKKYPRAMLRNRCQAELARAVYPDLVDGLYDPDEMGAITTEDGEVIEVRAERPSEPRSTPRPAVDTLALVAEFERRIGEVVSQSGTPVDLKAIGAEIGRSPLDELQREHLDQVYVMALETLEARLEGVR